MKEKNIEAEMTPTQEEIKHFWKNIWHNDSEFNENVEWLQTLKALYCKNVISSDYNITRPVLDKVIKKLHLNKSPGHDKFMAYWYKNLTEYRDALSA